MDFRINIEHFRLKQRLSQQELADMCNLSQMYICKLEKNVKTINPTLKTIEAIAKALKVCPYSLILFNCGENCNLHETCDKRHLLGSDDCY